MEFLSKSGRALRLTCVSKLLVFLRKVADLVAAPTQNSIDLALLAGATNTYQQLTPKLNQAVWRLERLCPSRPDRTTFCGVARPLEFWFPSVHIFLGDQTHVSIFGFGRGGVHGLC